MRAAILREYDATPELGEFDDPVPGDGTVAADVLAAGLNPVDLRKASGVFPLMPKPPLPSVAGWEGVARLEDGSRVYFVDPPPPARRARGAHAARPVRDLPRSRRRRRRRRGRAGDRRPRGLARARPGARSSQSGETVLVLGATGTVGQVAVQAAKLLGASRVVAAGRNPHGLARAAELGADATVRLGEEGDLAERFRGGSRRRGGFDVIVDPLWGEPALAAMEAANRFARHVALGQSAGLHAAVSVATVRNTAADDRRPHELRDPDRGPARGLRAHDRARRGGRAHR